MPHRVYCRATFTEICIRLSKYVYCDIVDKKDLKNANEWEIVPLPKALKFFIDDKLKWYFLDQELNRSSFREEKLWDHDVDMVFSMN